MVVEGRSAVVGSAVFVPKWHRNSERDYAGSVANCPSAPPAPSPPFPEPLCTESRRPRCREKDSTGASPSGSNTRCPLRYAVSCSTSRNSPFTFFAQAALLPLLRSCRDAKPSQQALRQRPRALRWRRRPARAAGVVLLAGPARRLRPHVPYFPGRGAAAAHGPSDHVVVLAGSAAGGRFDSSDGPDLGSVVSLGDSLSSAAPAA